MELTDSCMGQTELGVADTKYKQWALEKTGTEEPTPWADEGLQCLNKPVSAYKSEMGHYFQWTI